MRRRVNHRLTRGERGVALLVVLSSLALVGTVVTEFQFNSRVDLQLAFNARDELQAEYSALSALRLRALLLRNATMLNGLMSGLTQAGIMPPGMTLPIGQILEMVPVECGLMSTIVHKAGPSFDPKASHDNFFPGECMATSKSEGTKIGLNSFARASFASQMAAQPQQQAGGGAGAGINNVVTRLVTLLSNPSLRHFFEQDDKNGGHAESPQALIGNIIDWVDLNHTQFGNDVADEDRLYSHLKDSYKVKNAPFDSISELKLVYGVSDGVYGLLKDSVSAYVDSSTIELAVADPMQIATGLAMLLAPGVDPAIAFTSPGIPKLFGAIDQLRSFGGAGMGVLNVQVLSGLITQFGLASFFNTAQISQVFTDTPQNTWFTITAEGQVGNASRRIRAVFQAIEPQIYYYRIE